ncbi:putative ubiquitin [Cardiosporidium cionae]|uniref:Ubiquitin n=1 Tax=Cardiosporidium cionae TaxID=476202 RepID=A0ABQ7J3M0_9APIC|nr:putative ubiquitin [Cardiosporidium cionae]|eukprot:KAF8817664.1 putative ubiquitin [Cardiosporidium cionae]
MAVTLVVSDWSKGQGGCRHEIQNIDSNLTGYEIKGLISQEIQSSFAAEELLLVQGNRQIEDSTPLSEYNRSNRKTIQLNLHSKTAITLNVMTRQAIVRETCACFPFWGLLCRQRIKIHIMLHESVGDLKQKLADKINIPNK